MIDTQKNLLHLSIDGKMFPCHPAGEFGFLGDRVICDLVSASGHSPKKLLCRKKLNDGDDGLEIDKVPEAGALGLRPLVPKTYQTAIPSADRKLKREEHQFLQQDITGLITLRAAILRVVAEGSPRKVWHLFYSACKALNGYGKSIGGQRLVPLQCPNGLAVNVKTGQVVMLDAEMKIPTLSDSSDEAAFVKWFGSAGRFRYARANEASMLHSKRCFFFPRGAWLPPQERRGCRRDRKTIGCAAGRFGKVWFLARTRRQCRSDCGGLEPFRRRRFVSYASRQRRREEYQNACH